MHRDLKEFTPKLRRLKSEEYDINNPTTSQLYSNSNKIPKNYEQNNQKSIKNAKYKNILQNKYNSGLEEKYSLLQIENSLLKKQILELKLSQFYIFDNTKIKQLLKGKQNLKNSLSECRQLLKKVQSQNQRLRNINQELKQELYFGKKQLISLKQTQLSNKTLAKTNKNYQQDQQLTLRVLQKPILKSSQIFDNFQEYRLLLETENSSKQQLINNDKKIKHEQNSTPKINNIKNICKNQQNNSKLVHPLKDFQYLNYKSKRKINNIQNKQLFN